MLKEKNIKILITIIFASLSLFILSGCSNGTQVEIDKSDKVLVTYDGNGGFLGNQVSQARKLYATIDSKIPFYTSGDLSKDLEEEVDDLDTGLATYVVSSLGEAHKDGYNLAGWYVKGTDTYQESATGSYIKLENGNGYYTLDSDGDYVYRYVESDEGTIVNIIVQDPVTDLKDTAEIPYIFLDGEFVMFDIENENHVVAKDLYGEFTYKDVSTIEGYQIIGQVSYGEVTQEQQDALEVVIATLPTYTGDYELYDELIDAETAAKYSFIEGYVEMNTVMEEKADGDYVYDFESSTYELYASDAKYADYQRYSVNEKYIFTSTAEVPTVSYLTQYAAHFEYWDFTTDRVTAEMQEDGLILIASWQKKITVHFVDLSGSETLITTKRNSTNTGNLPLEKGETIYKPQRIPTAANYTFVCWSKTKGEYDPWDFVNEVFPENSNELYLYAYMIEGNYSRITTSQELAKVSDDLNGNYVVINDIDLGGKVYSNSTPLGMSVTLLQNSTVLSSVFTGNFVSYGTISNYTLTVNSYAKAILTDIANNITLALFPYTMGATIKGVTLEDVKLVVTSKGSGIVEMVDCGIAPLVGTALTAEEMQSGRFDFDIESDMIDNEVTVIENCSITCVVENSDPDSGIVKNITVGDVNCSGNGNMTITETTADTNYSALVITDEGSLILNALD